MLSFREGGKIIKSIFNFCHSVCIDLVSGKLTISKVCLGDSVDFAPFSFYFRFAVLQKFCHTIYNTDGLWEILFSTINIS